jgi:SAM-dependent methyltransferase
MPEKRWTDYAVDKLQLIRGSRFFERWFHVVYPEAKRRGLLGKRHGDHGQGDYATVAGALKYVARNPIKHYASLVRALRLCYEVTDDEEVDFPARPLVVDLGCGPGTAAFAVLDWLRAIFKPEVAPEITYLGIDTPGMRYWAKKLFAGELRDGSFILKESLAAIHETEIVRLAQDRDGVVFVASYILEQRFMGSVRPLADLIRKVRKSTYGLGADLLVQDVNRFEEHHQRLRDLAMLINMPDVTVSVRNHSLSQPKIWVERPDFLAWEPAETSERTGEPSRNVFYSFQQIARPR